ncbi:signal recognition particle receptor subunit beta [Marchantia polymorpha subsp. ruderalis]|uniref:Signal recognition particle receptor subunit beta n=2 Tax=Marchantia polymorpha TaxID=3197 RepID=A0A176WBV8_MARPO|nr:hypothetical protein AXG93_3016s1090 [Marchantia polymorpha subsp. ruderalis]PTQ48326.1 hypothetical protein MARPO_0005s0007 [Marchantia polymorpha]BBM97479.1 hypothetical protein Mp_1g06020 [Marchantia polymorpha subsp. ruderalis]|eukprot:PTQ48326.1 hypothetical protein MARPO_0005s0007 [Marchantia polymorpha]
MDQDLQQRVLRGLSSAMDHLQNYWSELQGVFQQHFSAMDEQTAVLVTLGVFVFTLLLVYVVIRGALKGNKRDTILLLGLSGAGKTALFYQLRDGSVHNGTVTSMEPNEGRFILNSESGEKKGKKSKPVHIVDVPGHPRLKTKIDELLPQASGIVFVVDALDFMSQLRPTAEYLYDVLTKAWVVKKKIPVLLTCNKIDKVTAHSMDFIRKQLEKEIEKLRVTRKTTSDADVGTEISIGSDSSPFQFTQCSNKVSIVETSVLQGKITEIEVFIKEYVPR